MQHTKVIVTHNVSDSTEKITDLRYSDSDNRIFNCFISDISVVLRETTLTIYDSIARQSNPK